MNIQILLSRGANEIQRQLRAFSFAPHREGGQHGYWSKITTFGGPLERGYPGQGYAELFHNPKWLRGPMSAGVSHAGATTAHRQRHTGAGEPAPVRHQWMDLARGVAILLVVQRHIGGAFTVMAEQAVPWLEPLDHAFESFRIPLLIFLSGFLLDRSLDKGLGRFIDGKFRNLIWPYLVWMAIFVCVPATRQSMDLGDILAKPADFIGGGYLWYIVFLAVYFGVATLVIRVPHLVTACFAIALATLLPDGSRFGERMFLLMSYFFIGALAGRNLDRFTDILRNPWAPWLASVGVAFSIHAIHIGGTKYETETAAIALVSIIAFCALAIRADKYAVVAPIRYVGRHSLIFYVVHLPVVFLVYRVLDALGIASLGVFFVVAFVVCLGVPTLIVWSTKRSALLRPLFALPPALSLSRIATFRKLTEWLDKKLAVSDTRFRRPLNWSTAKSSQSEA